jgi:hypothetical protein
MSLQTCPHCKQPAFSWRQKYMAAKWVLLTCPLCGGRSCSNPFLLAFFTMLYVWDVMLFGYLTYLTHILWYPLVLVVGWLILDYFSLFLPLSAMKPKSEASQ